MNDLDALGILDGFRLRSWRWRKRNNKKGTVSRKLTGDRVRGYIADEVEKVYPEGAELCIRTGAVMKN